ncbi:MAG: GNAT family N-acetyltransferase [Armatimonadetes bacterium]|nr:GNAT family N-acetyltransferase [Armatimonadota bacterium]
MPWLQPVTLENDLVRLEPAGDEHWADLLACSSPETLKYFVTMPETWDADGMRDWILTRTKEPFLTMVVRDQRSGTVVGSSTFFDVFEAHHKLEIGYTWYQPNARGTYVNPSSKLLMLEHCFETLKTVRVQLKCDDRNAASKAAMLKMGAKAEGIQRSHMVLADGHLRNTAFFSVIAPEWEEVRASLVERLETFRQKAS